MFTVQTDWFLNAPRPVYTANLKPPAVDNCRALPGTAGDITPYQMAEVYMVIINYREVNDGRQE